MLKSAIPFPDSILTVVGLLLEAVCPTSRFQQNSKFRYERFPSGLLHVDVQWGFSDGNEFR
jgi:hypothetical protein